MSVSDCINCIVLVLYCVVLCFVVLCCVVLCCVVVSSLSSHTVTCLDSGLNQFSVRLYLELFQTYHLVDKQI